MNRFEPMISILIPIYNTDTSHLVQKLYKQCLVQSVEFEILGWEDGSTNYTEENSQAFKQHPKTKLYSLSENKGRIATRHQLAEKAKFNWLLFLDADVMPITNDFMSIYLNALESNADVVFGGFAYTDRKPEQHVLLRWAYGRRQEAKAARLRNPKPYKLVISANMAIKKTLFLELTQHLPYPAYGLDNYLAALLKKNRSRVRHIDNNVYHLGLESSEIYLMKMEKAVETLLQMKQMNPTLAHENSLLSLYEKMGNLGLTDSISQLYLRLKPRLRKNLLGPNPNIKLLQFYRLGHMCYLAKQKK